MVISESEASAFIQGYTQVMTHIYKPQPNEPQMAILATLAAARAQYMADRSLLKGALRELKAKSITLAPEVVSAIHSLEVKQWIYLKDTSAYSVFIDPSLDAAYGVLGLTEKIRNIIDGSGAILETGLVRYLGRYVSDGIVSKVVFLGRNYKQNFSNEFARLRAQGAFRRFDL
jgi:hypothetical protein